MSQLSYLTFIHQKGLTLNQYSLLYQVHEGINIVNVQQPEEYDFLYDNGYLTRSNGIWKVTPKSTRIINYLNSLFSDTINNKKAYDTNEVDTLITQLREIYPRKKDNGTLILSSKRDVKTHLERFFRVNDYEFSTIVEATRRYVKQQEENFDKRYMMHLKYFIMKDGTSTLSSYCDDVLNNPIESKITAIDHRFNTL
jgi:hypothetical protein